MRALLVLIPLTSAVVLVGTAAHEPVPANVEAMVNDRRLVLPPRANVGLALLDARTLPRDGVLYSVVTHSPIDPRWDPGRVLLQHRPTRLDERLRTGDRIEVIDGVDAVEGTVEREVPVQVQGGRLPDIERDLWTPGTDGMSRETVGERSGEIVQQVTMREPLAASRVPGPVLALTFDDGPDPRFTPQVLEALATVGVKATFCIVGRDARRHPELVRAIAEQGHALCDHTQNHRFLDGMGRDQIESEITQPMALIEQITGRPPTFLRAPGGHLSPTVIETAHQHNLRILGWAVDPQDWLAPSVPAIVDRVVGAARPGAIVVLHDGGGDRTSTVAALPVIIQRLASRGYSFIAPPTAPPPG